MDLSKKGIKRYLAKKAVREEVYRVYQEYFSWCTERDLYPMNFTSYMAMKEILKDRK